MSSYFYPNNIFTNRYKINTNDIVECPKLLL